VRLKNFVAVIWRNAGASIPLVRRANNGIDLEANMDTLGVILARAGSVGLPSKHLLPLLGRAVIEYTFDHAEAAKMLSRVVVSTDCPGVTRLALQRGLEVIHRPPELATSDASVQDVMLHALDMTGVSPDALVVLYGNVPVRGAGVIDRALSHLKSTGCDSVRTFCPVGKWHPAWMSKLDGDVVVPVQQGSIHRRQDLTPLFLHDGAVVAVTDKAMARSREFRNDPHAFFGVDRRGIQTQAGETVEIDHQRDLYWAEAVLRDQQIVMKEAA
jgi:N-acylneuraminate cytidylyltransferase